MRWSLGLLLAMAAAIVPQTGSAYRGPLPTAASRAAYPNAAIADKALEYVGRWGGEACRDAGKLDGGNTGRTVGGYGAGQCRTFVNCILFIVSGGTQYPTGTYFKSFLQAGGVEVKDVGNLVKGDIVQWGNGVHTYIVVGPAPQKSDTSTTRTFAVVDSNSDGKTEMVAGPHPRKVTLDKTQRAFRMGVIRKASDGPTLGVVWGPYQKGYGETKPSTIFNGGDPTGLVESIRWTGWGKARALGRGIGDWVWPGNSVAGGSISTLAVVVAWDLGQCEGHLAYRKLDWYFPSRGDVFDPRWGRNICPERGVTYLPQPRLAKCGGVALQSPRGRASEIEAGGMTCRKARQVVAGSPSVRYLYRHEGRFRYAGLYCGTEGYYGGPPTLFECARGRILILYEVAV